MLRKLLGALALTIAVLWILHNPAQAAADVRHIIRALTTLVSAL